MHRSDHDTVSHGEAGYTLTEMLIVIVIISLIAAVLTPSLLGQLARARVKTASLQLESTVTALGLFKDDVGRFPTQAEGLQMLVADSGNTQGWLGPYLKSAKALNDPWGRPLIYAQASDGSATVTCLGADGKPGGKGVDQDLTESAR